MLRLFKAFIISLVAVYTFVNGPRLYATIQFWIGDLKPQEQGAAAAVSAVKPMRLPVSESDQQPLPNQATMIIDRIGVSAPVVFGVPPVNQTIYDNLGRGVIHYAVTPKPGQGGASVILGHSSLYPWQVNQFGAPFALLGKLEPGDRITVRYSDGRTYNYAMKKSIVFNPLQSEEDERLQELERSPRPLLLLVTCWPINTTQSRLAVQAELE